VDALARGEGPAIAILKMLISSSAMTDAESQMSFVYILHEKAQQDYGKAIKWYLKRSPDATEV